MTWSESPISEIRFFFFAFVAWHYVKHFISIFLYPIYMAVMNIPLLRWWRWLCGGWEEWWTTCSQNFYFSLPHSCTHAWRFILLSFLCWWKQENLPKWEVKNFLFFSINFLFATFEITQVKRKKKFFGKWWWLSERKQKMKNTARRVEKDRMIMEEFVRIHDA